MKDRWFVPLLFACGVLLAACGQSADPVPPRPTSTPEVASTRPAGSRSVKDMAGRTVSIDEEVRKVVALSPAATDFAVALGLEVIGRTSDTPETAAPGAKPIGSTLSPDFNAIAALDPDLVIADAAYHSGRVRDFDRFSHPVYILKANSYQEVLDALTALGEAAGRVETAANTRQAIATRAEATIASARAKAESGAAPRVLLLTGGGRDVFAGGPASYLGNLIEQLRGMIVFGTAADGGPIAGFGVVETTQAAALNPDVVLILSSGQGGLAAQIKADPAWANTTAVRQGRIHELDTTLFLRAPGPRVAEALETLLPLLWR